MVTKKINEKYERTVREVDALIKKKFGDKYTGVVMDDLCPHPPKKIVETKKVITPIPEPSEKDIDLNDNPEMNQAYIKWKKQQEKKSI